MRREEQVKMRRMMTTMTMSRLVVVVTLGGVLVKAIGAMGKGRL
jgi:hypothetical protein|tara:strand:+ start:718 stop:849 length:132 start_codon:yes stop_codon:yes gene_type:complete